MHDLREIPGGEGKGERGEAQSWRVSKPLVVVYYIRSGPNLVCGNLRCERCPENYAMTK